MGEKRGRAWLACFVASVVVFTACGGGSGGGGSKQAAPPSATPTSSAAAPAAGAPAGGQPATAAPVNQPGTGDAASSAPAPSAGGSAAAKSAAPIPAKSAASASAPSAGGSAAAKSAAPAPGAPAPSGSPQGGSTAPPAPGGGAPVGGGACNGAGTLSAVAVGHVSALSGAPGATLGGARIGAQAWGKWINRHCGLNGHPVKLFVEDSASDPTRYVGILKRLVEQEHVIGLFGNMQPLEGDAGVAYLNEKQVPLIGGAGWNKFNCEGGMNFYTGPCLTSMAVGVVQAAVKQGKTKIALFYCGEANLCRDYREATYSPDATKTGAEIVVSKQISITQPDFTSECLAAKDKGAQAISLYMDAGSMSRLARSCANQDYHPVLLGGGAMGGPKHPEDANISELYTAYNVVPWIVTDLPAVAEYRSAIAEFGDTVWPTSGVVWADGMLLRAASVKLPADNPTPQDLVKGLYSLKNETLGGLIQPATFSPDQKTRGSSCFFPLVIKDHKWVAPLGAKQECAQ